MRGLLKFLGIVGFLVALYYIRDYWDGRHIEHESSAFAVNAVNAATLEWKEADFKKFEDPNLHVYLVNSAHNARLVDNLPFYSKLGKRKVPAVCTMEDYSTYKAEKEDFVGVTYLCQADFENAAASITVQVRRFTSSGAWKMSYFDVYSSYLVASLKPAPVPKNKRVREQTPWEKFKNRLPSIPSFSD